MKYLFFSLILLTVFCACIWEPEETLPSEVVGLRPIYIDEQLAEVIEATEPQPIVRLGKIYYKDETIYVNESNLGVHVIDNSDPAAPVKTKFLKIPGCHDIAIKGNILYADNVGDLVAIDISDLDYPKVVKRLSGLQDFSSQGFPEFYEGWFECVDEGRGIVVGWEETILDNPQCWR